MSVISITTADLRKMKDSEGLILQGCGGELQEWVDGINEMLTKEGVLLEGSKFKNCSTFEYSGNTCLLFPFDGMKIHGGKFAIWRLQTYEMFGGTWLSDFVPNRLGGFINETEAGNEVAQKPDCPLIGQDGNIFNLMGIASRTLKENGMEEQVNEMKNRIMHGAANYYEALNIIGEYVNITSIDDEEDETEDYEEGMGISQ